MSKITDQFLISVVRKLFSGIAVFRDKQGLFLHEQIINKGEIKDEKINFENARSFSYNHVAYATQASGERVQVMMTIMIDATIPEVKKAEKKPDLEN